MKTRKSILILLAAWIVFSLCGCAPDAVDSHGRPISISNYRGKWVVINYWATWCTPCIQEIPDLIKMATYYKDKVVVLGVNIDNLADPVLNNIAEGYGINYSVLRSFPIEKWDGKPTQLPVTYIINPRGHLYQTLKGPQTLQHFQAIMGLPDITYQ